MPDPVYNPVENARDSKNLHKPGQSIICCFRTMSLEQLIPRMRFCSYCFGVAEVAEDAPVI